eukprot:GHVT01025219.1.p1 GENE.GHVT01025219.1~~GHVT01025219.1.p1  ORF type:complete len:445 (+),score=39.01 GHVT01025219.1:323-1657(+)
MTSGHWTGGMRGSLRMPPSSFGTVLRFALTSGLGPPKGSSLLPTSRPCPARLYGEAACIRSLHSSFPRTSGRLSSYWAFTSQPPPRPIGAHLAPRRGSDYSPSVVVRAVCLRLIHCVRDFFPARPSSVHGRACAFPFGDRPVSLRKVPPKCAARPPVLSSTCSWYSTGRPFIPSLASSFVGSSCAAPLPRGTLSALRGNAGTCNSPAVSGGWYSLSLRRGFAGRKGGLKRKKTRKTRGQVLQLGIGRREEFFWPKRARRSRVPMYQNARPNLIYDRRLKRWLVMWYEAGTQVFRPFTTRRQGFEMARFKALRLLGDMKQKPQWWLSRAKPSKTVSGVRGVHFDAEERLWVAVWNHCGLKRYRAFSAIELGFDEAYRAAVAVRRSKLAANHQFVMQTWRKRVGRRPHKSGQRNAYVDPTTTNRTWQREEYFTTVHTAKRFNPMEA